MAQSPDPRFFCSSDIESYFVEKDTGAPLSDGQIYFYEDENRTVLKPVYQLTGSPPNYSFSELPNPLSLSSVGTYSYMNNDIVIYYFPYEGTPDESNGVLQLYYIEVKSAPPGLILQYTREAWPPNIGSGSTPSDNSGSRNYIPNGQFLTHTDIVGTDQPPIISAGGEDIQYIAQGGWSFRRTTGGASLFNNSFTSLSGTVAGLNDYPRNAFNFVCTSFSNTDQVRDLCIEWEDTNKFSSGDPVGTQAYTYFFAAESLDSNSYTFDVRLIRNYGTGGTPSASTDTSIGTVVITPSYTYYTVNITGIPPATGTFGTNGDDYILIALRGPASSWAIQVTDFGFFAGQQQLTSYPVQTDADMLTRSVAGWMPIPNPDGSDLYLPLILTPKGMTWQTSEVGQIKATLDIKNFSGSLATNDSYMICDGSAYVTADYSPIGVPYSRLFNVLFDSTTLCPYMGTGIEYATAYIPSVATDTMRLVTNQMGAQTATADGTTPTGFGFSTLYTGNDYDQNSYVTNNLNEFFTYTITAGSVTAPTVGTAPITLYFNQINGVAEPANAGINNFFYGVITVLPTGGQYFTFSNTTTNYYVWFTVNGVGADPAPGGTGILVPLLSTYTTAITAQMIREAISGFQGTLITFLPASSIPAGAYFSFHANSSEYIVWYKIGGVGSPPAVTATFIEVDLAGTETNAQVCAATTLAINSYQYAVPNLKGTTLRGWNVGDNNIPGDLSAGIRLNIPSQPFLEDIATYQWSQILSHSHVYVKPPDITNKPVGNDPGITYADSLDNLGSFPRITNSDDNTTFYGGPETTPFNFAVNYIIKY